MWSVGCIVSEMLRVLLKHADVPADADNVALFQGGQCFPISPKHNSQKEVVIDSKE